MKQVKSVVRELPPDVIEADLTHAYGDALPWDSLPEGTTSFLIFYQVKVAAWVGPLTLSAPCRPGCWLLSKGARR